MKTLVTLTVLHTFKHKRIYDYHTNGDNKFYVYVSSLFLPTHLGSGIFHMRCTKLPTLPYQMGCSLRLYLPATNDLHFEHNGSADKELIIARFEGVLKTYKVNLHVISHRPLRCRIIMVSLMEFFNLQVRIRIIMQLLLGNHFYMTINTIIIVTDIGMLV